MARPRSRAPHVLFALHCGAALFCVAGPGYAWWGASARPFVLGLPWPLVWVLGWLLAMLLALALYERFNRRAESDER